MITKNLKNRMKKHIIILLSTFFSINSYCQTIELQEALDFLNNVRSNPNAYSSEIGVSLIDVHPMPPLKWNKYLAVAAQRKAEDMADRNYMAHIDPDGYGMNYFIQNAGFQLNSDWLVNISMNNFESLSAGSSNPRESILNLIKDEGVIGYGHRKHLLAIDDFWKPCYDIGIGWGYNINSYYKRYCCVLIAKHDWNGDTQNAAKDNVNKFNESTQYFQPTYNSESIRTIESSKITKTINHKLLSFKIGASANVLFDNINKLNGSFSNQLNTMVGFILGKSKKNTSVGIFVDYGKYNANNPTLLGNNLLSSSNNFLEIEGGFLIKEYFRISGGLGYSSSNSINLSSNDYTTFSAGFSLGPKWLKVDIINTLILPKENKKLIYRPSLGLSFVLNFFKKNQY